jgi:hypothetical protein
MWQVACHFLDSDALQFNQENVKTHCHLKNRNRQETIQTCKAHVRQLGKFFLQR